MSKKKAKKVVKKTKKTAPKEAKEAPPKITPYPTAGPKIQAFENKLDEQLAGGPQKRGRGRPRKEDIPEQEQPEITKQLIVGAVKMPFELWSIREKVEGLALTEPEAGQLAEPIRLLIEHYLPQIPPIAYAWGSLAVGAFWIMRSRLLLIAAIKEQNELLRASAGAEGPDSTRGPGRPIPADSTKMPTMEQIKKPRT